MSASGGRTGVSPVGTCIQNPRPGNVNGVEGASIWPKAVHRFRNGQVLDEKWNGGDLLDIESQGLIMLEWGYKQ